MKVPKGWSIEPLENICSIFDAQRIPLNNEDRQKRLLGKEPEELYPYYGSTGQVGYVDDFIFNGEYLLIGEDGAPFLENKDKAYIVSGKFWVNNHAHILKAKYSNQYLCYFLNQFDYRKYVTGATRLKLTQAALRSIPVLIPENVETQTQIAQILDKSTALIAKRKAQIAELDKLVQSVFLEMFGDPITNSKKWDKKRLSEICDVRDGTHNSPSYTETGFPLITSKNIINDNIDFCNVNLISKYDFDEINKRSKVDKGDILMPMIGTVGNPVIVRTDKLFAIKNVALIKFKENLLISNVYIQYLLKSKPFERYIDDIKRGGTQKFISLTMIRNFEIIVPQIDFQTQFAQIAEKIHAQKSLLQKSLAELEMQHQALMQKAFNGQLVG